MRSNDRGVSMLFPDGPVRTKAEWLAIESPFALGDKDARDWVHTEAWLLAIRMTAERNPGRTQRYYHEILDLSSDAYLRSAENIDKWEPSGGSRLRSWVYGAVLRGTLNAWNRRHREMDGLISIEGQDGGSMAGVIPDRPGGCPFHADESAAILADALAAVSPAHMPTVAGYFGLGRQSRTMRQMAAEWRVSRKRLYQRLDKAIGQMAARLECRGITVDMMMGD